MAVTATPISCRAALTLNKGQDSSTGKTISGTSSISNLAAGADNTKIYNVAALLAACVAYPTVRIVKTESVELENE